MKRIALITTALALSLQVGFASPQNIATISDLKEVIQILLKHKKRAEDRLLLIEKKLGITNEFHKEGAGGDTAIDAGAASGESVSSSEVEKLRSEITDLQAAIKALDPDANITGNDDLKSKTYVNQKQFEEFQKFVKDELKSIKDITDRANALMANGGLGNTGSNEIWERLKKLEAQMKKCQCGLPESEIK